MTEICYGGSKLFSFLRFNGGLEFESISARLHFPFGQPEEIWEVVLRGFELHLNRYQDTKQLSIVEKEAGQLYKNIV